jgi:hypothetical protein
MLVSTVVFQHQFITLHLCRHKNRNEQLRKFKLGYLYDYTSAAPAAVVAAAAVAAPVEAAAATEAPAAPASPAVVAAAASAAALERAAAAAATKAPAALRRPNSNPDISVRVG